PRQHHRTSIPPTTTPSWRCPRPNMPGSNREEEDRSRLDGFEIEIFKLLRREATPEQWKEWLRAPLEHAAAEGNLDLFTRLMDAGANTEAGWRGCHGRTLLGAAAFGRSEKMIRTLLTAGATDDVNVLFGGESESALHVAAARGADDTCRALMIAGADPNLRDRRQRSPLHVAAEAGHHRVAGSLLLNKSDVDARTAYRETPLHLAASEGQALCISELLLGGADKDVVDGYGQTPLFRAAKNNHPKAVEELLAAGANCGLRSMCSNGSRCSPLEIAAGRGHADVLKALLDKGGSEVDTANDLGWAALHDAASFDGTVRDNGDAVRVLLGAGADVDVKTTDDICACTPLHVAVWHWMTSTGTVRALLEGGANVHARAAGDDTPLHIACSRVSGSAVELLLRWGADEKLPNNNGDTPADVIGGSLEQKDFDDEERKADKQRIRQMLARAPADRSWRRRGWLVLSRSCPTRVHIANGGSSSSISSTNGNSAKVARVSGEGSSRDDEETEDQMMVDLRDLVGRLVGLEAEGLFRLVVGFL
ncbi:unnamed protein product, partial [Ectocarpus sp. 6 AP-2014]